MYVYWLYSKTKKIINSQPFVLRILVPFCLCVGLEYSYQFVRILVPFCLCVGLEYSYQFVSLHYSDVMYNLVICKSVLIVR